MLLNIDVGRVLEYGRQPRKQMNGSLNKINLEFSLKPLGSDKDLASKEDYNAGKDGRKGRKEEHD